MTRRWMRHHIGWAAALVLPTTLATTSHPAAAGTDVEPTSASTVTSTQKVAPRFSWKSARYPRVCDQPAGRLRDGAHHFRDDGSIRLVKATLSTIRVSSRARVHVTFEDGYPQRVCTVIVGESVWGIFLERTRWNRWQATAIAGLAG